MKLHGMLDWTYVCMCEIVWVLIDWQRSLELLLLLMEGFYCSGLTEKDWHAQTVPQRNRSEMGGGLWEPDCQTAKQPKSQTSKQTDGWVTADSRQKKKKEKKKWLQTNIGGEIRVYCTLTWMTGSKIGEPKVKCVTLMQTTKGRWERPIRYLHIHKKYGLLRSCLLRAPECINKHFRIAFFFYSRFQWINYYCWATLKFITLG